MLFLALMIGHSIDRSNIAKINSLDEKLRRPEEIKNMFHELYYYYLRFSPRDQKKYCYFSERVPPYHPPKHTRSVI